MCDEIASKIVYIDEDKDRQSKKKLDTKKVIPSVYNSTLPCTVRFLKTTSLICRH